MFNIHMLQAAETGIKFVLNQFHVLQLRSQTADVNLTTVKGIFNVQLQCCQFSL